MEADTNEEWRMILERGASLLESLAEPGPNGSDFAA